MYIWCSTRVGFFFTNIQPGWLIKRGANELRNFCFSRRNLAKLNFPIICARHLTTSNWLVALKNIHGKHSDFHCRRTSVVEKKKKRKEKKGEEAQLFGIKIIKFFYIYNKFLHYIYILITCHCCQPVHFDPRRIIKTFMEVIGHFSGNILAETN